MDIQEQKNIVLSYINPSLLIKGLIAIILFYALVFVAGVFQTSSVLKERSALVLDTTLLRVEKPTPPPEQQAQQSSEDDIEIQAEIYNPSQINQEIDDAEASSDQASESTPQDQIQKPAQQQAQSLSVEQLEAAFYGNPPVKQWIPQNGPNGETVFETYSYDNKFPTYNDESRIEGKISLVFIEAGTTSPQVIDSVVSNLPPVFSFAWYPYAKEIQPIAKSVYLKGFENWATLLIQPENYPLSDLGNLALTPDIELQEAAKMVAAATMDIPYAVGYISNQRTRYFENRRKAEDMRKIFSTLGMGYIHGRNDLVLQQSYVDQLAYAEKDLVIDNVANDQTIRANLSNLEKIAKESGYAIGYVHLYPKTVQVLQDWIQTIQSKNLQLVSTSSLLRGEFNGQQ